MNKGGQPLRSFCYNGDEADDGSTTVTRRNHQQHTPNLLHNNNKGPPTFMKAGHQAPKNTSETTRQQLARNIAETLDKRDSHKSASEESDSATLCRDRSSARTAHHTGKSQDVIHYAIGFVVWFGDHLLSMSLRHRQGGVNTRKREATRWCTAGRHRSATSSQGRD